MTATRYDDPATLADLLLFRLMHRSMRQDARALRLAVNALDPGDDAAVVALADWYRSFETAIVHHQVIEDAVLTPVLDRLDASSDHPGASTHPAGRLPDVRRRLAADHRHRDQAIARLRGALVRAARRSPTAADLREIRAAAADLDDLLAGHIEREEALAFPLLRALHPAEQVRLQQEAADGADPHTFPFVGPWLVDHAEPHELEQLAEAAPHLVAPMCRSIWRRGYERRSALVRAQRRGPGRSIHPHHRISDHLDTPTWTTQVSTPGAPR